MNLTLNNNESAPLPVPEAHKSFVMGKKRYYCKYISKMNRSEWCDFSKATHQCFDMKVQLVDYVEWISCTDMSWELAISIIIIFSILLMVMAYSNARSYAPNMIAVLYYMNIEEYNAGSLFVNIVNNTPHLLLWLNYGSDSAPDLRISDVIGAALAYLCSIGVFFVFFPADVPYNRFCKRDAIYQSVMITYVLVMSLGEFHLVHGYVWLIIHLLYLIICSMENFLFSVFNTVPRQTKSLESNINRGARPSVDTRRHYSVESIVPELTEIKSEAKHIGTIRMMKIKPPSQTSHIGDTRLLFTDFFRVLNPFRYWSSLTRVEKVLITVASPFRIIVKLCVPLVNLKSSNSGWSKLLITVNILCSTIIFKYAFHISFYNYIYQFLIPSLFVSFLIFGNTSIRTPPKYHHAFAIYGICMSWTISLIIFNEMFALNNAARIFLGWTMATANYSIIGWGLVVEGIITNFTFARMKFKNLAMGAFFCAPVMLINFEFSMKVITYMVSYGVSEGKVKDSSVNETGIYFMLIGTWSMTIITFLTDCHFRRSVGIFFISFYGLFLTYLFLASYAIIHPYGVNHYPFASRMVEVFWA